jgi:hypothetical protein
MTDKQFADLKAEIVVIKCLLGIIAGCAFAATVLGFAR